MKDTKNYLEIKVSLLNGIVNVHGSIALVGINENEGCLIQVNDELNYQPNNIKEFDGVKWLVVTNGDESSFSLKRRVSAEEKLKSLNDS